jgi:hypothetical protein
MKNILSILLISAFSLTSAFADVSPAPSGSPAIEAAASPAPPAEATAKWVNNQLQTALAETLTKTVSVMGDAKDFVTAQLPDVIQQLLMWKFYESLLPMVLWLAMSLIFIKWFFNTTIKNGDWNAALSGTPNYSTYDNMPKNGVPKAIIGGVKALFVLSFFLTFIFNINFTWLQILVAPKIYLLEYAKSMVSN